MPRRARYAALLASLLAAAPAAADLSVSGFLQQNTAVNTAGANPDGRNKKWLEERVQLKLNATAGSWRGHFKGDGYYDHQGRGGGVEVREAYLDYAAGAFDVRVGRQVITWGLGDLVFVNDFFPKDHEALFAGRPLEYLKRGVDALKLGAYPDFASFEFVLAPSFRESRIPDARRFWLFDPMPAVTNRETVKPGQGEWGLRAYRDVAGWDAALYLYRGYQRTPSMRPDSLSAPTRVTFFYPALSVLGASLTGRAGDGVLSLEAAYHDSRRDRAGTDLTIPNSQTRLLAAYQLQPWQDLTLNVQYYAERMQRWGNYLAALPAGFPVEKRWQQTASLRATQFYLHQTLRFSFYASCNTSNRDYFVNPELHYSFTDRVWGALGINLFGGKPWGQFGQLARNDNLYLQMRHQF